MLKGADAYKGTGLAAWPTPVYFFLTLPRTAPSTSGLRADGLDVVDSRQRAPRFLALPQIFAALARGFLQSASQYSTDSSDAGQVLGRGELDLLRATTRESCDIPLEGPHLHSINYEKTGLPATRSFAERAHDRKLVTGVRHARRGRAGVDYACLPLSAGRTLAITIRSAHREPAVSGRRHQGRLVLQVAATCLYPNLALVHRSSHLAVLLLRRQSPQPQRSVTQACLHWTYA